MECLLPRDASYQPSNQIYGSISAKSLCRMVLGLAENLLVGNSFHQCQPVRTAQTDRVDTFCG